MVAVSVLINVFLCLVAPSSSLRAVVLCDQKWVSVNLIRVLPLQLNLLLKP